MKKILLCLLAFFSMSIELQIFGDTKDVERIDSPPFEDILLVIHYNHPYYDSIEFLKELYSPFFPNITFYGEQEHPQVIAMPTKKGCYISEVLADIFIRFPNYKGYLVLQDDCLLNVWKYMKFDKDKIWYAITFRTPNNNNEVLHSWNPNFEKSKLKEEFFRASLDGTVIKKYWGGDFNRFHIDHHRGLQNIWPNLSPRDLQQLEKNIEKDMIVGQVCDMFYIPQRFHEDIVRLCPIFKNIFCEVAIPMIVNCLDSLENWEILKMMWNTNFSIEQSPTFILQDDFDWYHPVKFSTQNNRALALKFLQKAKPTSDK
jgi:hypothetical protein